MITPKLFIQNNKFDETPPTPKDVETWLLEFASISQRDDTLKRLIEVDDKQKELLSKLKQEQFDDIHSVLNAKMFIDSVIELETKKTLLIDILSKIK